MILRTVRCSMVGQCSVHCPSPWFFFYTIKFRNLGLISSSGAKGERKLLFWWVGLKVSVIVYSGQTNCFKRIHKVGKYFTSPLSPWKEMRLSVWNVVALKKKQEKGNLLHTSTAYCFVYCLHNEIALNTVYKTRRLRGSSRLQTGISSKMRTPHFKHFHNFNKYLHIYLCVNIFIGKVTRITWNLL